MDRGTENFESPLDEVLEGLPEEQPPADLKDRCIAALDAADTRLSRHARPAMPAWMQVMRNVAAAAAVLILVTGIYNVGIAPNFERAREKTRMMVSEAPAPPMSEQQEWRDEPKVESDQVRPQTSQPGGTAGPRAPGVLGVGMESHAYDATGAAGTEPEPSPAEAHAEPGMAKVGVAGTVVDEVRVVEAPPRAPVTTGIPELAGREVASEPAAPPAAGGDRVMRSVTSGETDPWRDMSGERQVVAHKQMEVEVLDVEQAYQDARAIITKRGGYVASDQVRIEEDGADSARLTVRLPIESFEDAIDDLRELGDVVQLVGESVDRTHEYYTRGAEVREMADRESDLLARYEAETNANKKRDLKRQLEALRAQMHAEKDLLGRLSEETHWPTLELTLSEAVGPAGWLSRSLRNSANALAWVGATAIIWLPAVVLVTLFWRRRTTPGAPEA